MLHLLLSLSLLAYVLPGVRVVEQVAKVRAKQTPLRIEAQLSGIGEDWPERVMIELHPESGTRVQDGRGGRWLIQGGQVVAGTVIPAPVWVPDLEILVLRTQDDLVRWLGRSGVNLSQNELARCGERDCFVLGTRGSDAQLWVDKDRFEVLRVKLEGGRGFEMAAYQDWQGRRFPSEIRILDHAGSVATLSVEAVSRGGNFSDPEPSPRGVTDTPAARAP